MWIKLHFFSAESPKCWQENDKVFFPLNPEFGLKYQPRCFSSVIRRSRQLISYIQWAVDPCAVSAKLCILFLFAVDIACSSRINIWCQATLLINTQKGRPALLHGAERRTLASWFKSGGVCLRVCVCVFVFGWMPPQYVPLSSVSQSRWKEISLLARWWFWQLDPVNMCRKVEVDISSSSVCGF